MRYFFYHGRLFSGFLILGKFYDKVREFRVKILPSANEVWRKMANFYKDRPEESVTEKERSSSMLDFKENQEEVGR